MSAASTDAGESRAGIRTIATPEDMHALGRELAARLRAGDLLVLSGPLGAGKTQLVRGIGEGLNVRGPITSPTFVLARTHPSLVGGPALVHADAYRLGSAAELDDLDLDFANAVVAVEWGAGLLDGVAESYLTIEIARREGDAPLGGDEELDDGPEPRTVTIAGHGPRWADGAASRD
ncbi:tRNA (adenosine(37)-N6)-threonylcarbamoyltransferase complex ATPase subunit type 1 TsaE [Naasia lichenicola]|uniref:tRNA threonylcarbamoyladenosine biosynthesis protein TsaE n=1 Tax=Naasia lichenicola TaxID=2565933 RepID=A0A4S4FI69_9MICO|nr:tRNA (adenosine(37)-N6)-threonylcarbamoyltransferase complex ATPase subunit type 1 TsaE [Naasia lichenicola]THG29748.1 tRNA (adenosine(37)-N6)-threonylcarbamoyltransferase complex ATPase subunit type 1 TsaE [Naasia lichenicola]